MTRSTVRVTLIAVGVILAIIGAVFAGQGLNLIPGSSMTGDRTWLYIGAAMVVVGIVLIALGARRRSTPGSGTPGRGR